MYVGLMQKKSRFVQYCAGLTMLVSVLVLLGWIGQVGFLKTVLPGYISMKANTAIGLFFLGAALFFLDHPNKKISFAVRAATAIAFLIGALTLAEYIFNVNLGIDELFFVDDFRPRAHFPAGRLAPITAINFLLITFGVFATFNRESRFFKWGQSFIFLAFLVSFQALTGYLMGVKYSFGAAYFSQMAVHTSLLFIILCAGLLFARNSTGLMKIVTSPTIAGRTARLLILSSIIVPPLVNWVQLQGEYAGFYDADFGVLIRIMGNVIFFLIVVWRTSTQLSKTETAQKEAEAKLVQSNSELEQRVLERTESIKTLNHELEKAAFEAKLASASKSFFLANMSHEIRTPINGVIGMTNLVLDSELSQQQREYLEIIRGSAESLLAIVNDILDLSKIESGKMDFEEIEFEVTSLVSDFAKSMRIVALQKKLDLNIEISPALTINVLGDPGRLRQVLTNLISNAIKFTEKGAITLRVKELPQKSTADTLALHFEVEDSGIGIADESVKKLFQPFTQADNTMSRRFGGTGLGLSICQRLVELMSGEIGVLSTLHVGSTFWFSIYLKKSSNTHHEIQLKTFTPLEFKSDNSRKILVVEDNFVNQKVARAMIEKIGHRVDTVGNGLEALKALEQIPYDLVLMDCQMPEMDGFEATQVIRSQTNTKLPHQIPIIAMTANALSGDKDRCLKAGMDDYISKPVNIQTLSKMLQKWLK